MKATYEFIDNFNMGVGEAEVVGKEENLKSTYLKIMSNR